MQFDEILSRFDVVQRHGDKAIAKCPSHDDQKPSLSIMKGADGRTLLHCHVNCSYLSICQVVGLAARDLFENPCELDDIRDDDKPWNWEQNGTLAAVYRYEDADGTLLYEKLRHESKAFRFRRPAPDRPDRHNWSLKDVQRPLYRFPEVSKAISDGNSIFVCEGEKDCDRLADHGFVATTNDNGAGSWSDEYTILLSDANRIVIVPDFDEKGYERARKLLEALPNAVVVELANEDSPAGFDLSDWFEAGHTKAEFEEKVRTAIDEKQRTLQLTPPGGSCNGQEVSSAEGVTRPKITNCRTERVGGKPISTPLSIHEISDTVFHVTGDWPRMCGGDMFVLDDDGAIRYITNHDQLFSYFHEQAEVVWLNPSNAMHGTVLTRREFFAHLQAKAREYDAVEVLPHEPPMHETFYLPQIYRHRNGEALGGLLDFFSNVETEHDRDLIRAMFVTPIWGGIPGTRPILAIDSSDRGHGKTSLADAMVTLYGGLDFDPVNLSDERNIARLLSPAGLRRRVVRIDNAKGIFRSSTLESLVTSSTISGRRNYRGEASRPNTLMYVVNGINLELSRDMAERCYVIRLIAPTFVSGWKEELTAYVDSRRHEIIGDIVDLLRREPAATQAQDRWQPWVANVLAKCTSNPDEVVRLNNRRRDESDKEVREANAIRDFLYAHARNAAGDRQTIFLASTEIVKLLSQVLGRSISTKEAAQILTAHVGEGRLPGVNSKRTSQANGWQVDLSKL